MRVLRYKQYSPPGGVYFYTVPETGVSFEHGVLDALVLEVRQHYVANKLTPPENLTAVIEDFICAQMPEGVCRGHGTTESEAWKHVSPQQVKDFTKLIFEKRRLGERFFVSQEEAEKRATICASCPFNLMNLCTTCTQLKGYAAKYLVGRATTQDRLLGVCGKCGCMLEAKVHVTKEALAKTQQHEYPPHCWLAPTQEKSDV